MSLMELCRLLNIVFNRREALYFPNPTQRLTLLTVAIGDLQTLVRRNQLTPAAASDFAEETRVDRALRRIFVRWRALVTLYGLPIDDLMAQKFPRSGCGYCGHLPCDCSSSARPEHQFPVSEPDLVIQRSWSLQQWQDHLAELYGQREGNQDLLNIVGQLFKETLEVGIELERVRDSQFEVDEIYQRIGLELADVLAWILAAARATGSQLEQRIVNHYRNGCPTCRRPINCSCRLRPIEQIEWGRPGEAAESFMT